MLAVYTFWDVMWTMIIFFAWVMYLTWVIMLMVDNFRRSDHSGWAKAGWFIFMIFLPIIGPFSYTLTRGSSADYAYDANGGYTPQGSASPAEELARLNDLRTEGAITDAEYESLKQKTLAVS
ncbi:MAG: SHOCT domain-containing protein [Gaiellaceae bacterium]